MTKILCSKYLYFIFVEFLSSYFKGTSSQGLRTFRYNVWGTRGTQNVPISHEFGRALSKCFMKCFLPLLVRILFSLLLFFHFQPIVLSKQTQNTPSVYGLSTILQSLRHKIKKKLVVLMLQCLLKLLFANSK